MNSLVSRLSLNDSLPREELRYHKMTDILVGPVGKMTSNAGPQGYVE